MLKSLLASGALLQGLKAEMRARASQIGFMIVCALIALLFLSLGLIALGVALFILIEPHIGAAGAAASIGGGAILIAIILILVGTRRKTATAATTKAPDKAVGSPLAGLAETAAQAPVPWLLGALVLGLVLGRRS